jgi:hypothetical protein
VLQEVHARLCKLYPECDIAHLPSDAIQLTQHAQQGVQQHVEEEKAEEQQEVEQQLPRKRAKLEECGVGTGSIGASESGRGEAAAPVDCACFVANAAVGGDSYAFHVDADPTSFPDGSPWHGESAG